MPSVYASSTQRKRADPSPDPPSCSYQRRLRADDRLAGFVPWSILREIWRFGIGNDQVALRQFRIAHAVDEIEYYRSDHIPGEEDQHSRLHREDQREAADD